MNRTVVLIENILTNICQNAYPYEWDENHLTFSLMRELRSLFQRRVVRFDNWSKIVDWQSFKNRGKQETNYGDIALLVNIQFSSGEVLKGVASLEAKRDFNSGNFESMAQTQLERIHKNLPYSHTLFYTHERNDVYLKFPDDRRWRSHMFVSPINTVKELNQQIPVNETWKLMRVVFPLSKFITSRIFWGLDLDFRQDVYDDIQKGLGVYANPAFLGVVNVYYEDQRAVELSLSDNWEEI